MPDNLSEISKKQCAIYYNWAKTLMNGKTKSYDEAVSIFTENNININLARLQQIATSDGNENVSIKEMAMMLYMLDGKKIDNINTHFDRFIEDKSEEGGDLTNSLQNIAPLSQFNSILDEFNEYEAYYKETNYPAQISHEVSDIIKQYNDLNVSHDIDIREKSGEIIFGDKFEEFEDWRSSHLYRLKDGTEYEISWGAMNIERPNGQREYYDTESGKLTDIARKLPDSDNYELLQDTDGDGYVDVRQIGYYSRKKGLINNLFRPLREEEKLKYIEEVSDEEAAQRIITNYLQKE